MHKITVVIPIYNRAKYFKRTLDSVVHQSYQNLEIIIIDDYSSDINELEKVLNEYSDNRIKLFKNMKNMNGAYSRNVGIKNASGKYVAFMDSDDTWELNKLERQIKIAETLNGNFLVTCKSKVIRRRFSEILPAKCIDKNEKVSDFLFSNNGYIPTPSIFLPATLAKKNLFNESLRRHQDYDFLLKLESINTKIYTIDEVLVNVYANHVETSEKRGANYKLSENFLIEYSNYFTEKAKNYFWIKNVGFYMSRNNEKKKLFKDFIVNKRYLRVDVKTLFIYINYFIFIDTPLYSFIEKVYLKIKGHK
jgi:glycosyltransferase involved in cell wall biosynthesis